MIQNNIICKNLYFNNIDFNLLIDIGNTNTKYIFLPVKNFCLEQFHCYPIHIISNKNSPSDIIKDIIRNIPNNSSIIKIHISNVFNNSIINAISDYFLITNDIVVHKSQQNFKSLINNYEDYTKLGCDRWLSIVAAHALCKEELIFIVSCGSATTLDIIYKNVFIGGYIIPGFRYMQTSLLHNTAQIMNYGQFNADYHNIFLDKIDNFFIPATNTTDAVNKGIILAQIGFIEKFIISFIKSNNNVKYNCIIHGGSAQMIGHLLSLPHTVVNNMVLLGLARIIND